ncbi:MAG: hypothetical protein R2704_04600 [Microthrixaceae bacterium]
MSGPIGTPRRNDERWAIGQTSAAPAVPADESTAECATWSATDGPAVAGDVDTPSAAPSTAIRSSAASTRWTARGGRCATRAVRPSTDNTPRSTATRSIRPGPPRVHGVATRASPTGSGPSTSTSIVTQAPPGAPRRGQAPWRTISSLGPTRTRVSHNGRPSPRCRRTLAASAARCQVPS